MQSPDVNVLVNAFREDAVHHERCRRWLDDAVSDRHPVSLSELVLSGVLRVLTHPRVFHPPTPSGDAMAFVDSLLAQLNLARCDRAMAIGASSVEWPSRSS